MKKILFFVLVFSISLFGQQIKSWQNYTDLSQVKGLVYEDGVFWAATNGGIFNYTENDQTFFKLTKSEGLSSQSTTAIGRDQENQIWIGTSEGYVDVYDPTTGVVNTIYDIIKENESNKRINDIQISGDTAFVSTEFGLILFNTTDNSVFDGILKFGDFASRTPVKSVLVGEKIYVVTQSGIANSIPSFANNLSAPEAWETSTISSVSAISKIIRENNTIYAATNRGIYEFSNDTWQQKYLTSLNVVDIIGSDGELYAVNWNYNTETKEFDKSLYNKIANGTETVLFEKNFLINKIYFSSSNLDVFASDEGIVPINDDNSEFIFPNAPETNSIIDVTVDSDGNLWTATGKNGLGIGAQMFDGSVWETISRNNSILTSNNIHKVSSSQNSIYFSTWGSGFAISKNNEFQIYDATNTSMIGIPSANNFLVINDIEEDENGNTWILNYWSADRKPLSVLTSIGEVINFQLPSSVSSSIINVKDLVIDQYGTKWFSGYLGGDVSTEGLFYFNEQNSLENTSDDVWGKITTSNGLRDEDVRALAIDQFGELIIGTSVGVDIISNTSTPNSIRGNQYFAMRQQTINCIAVDPINQKWFGTEKGIFLMSSDGSALLANYTKDNSPLPTDIILSLAIDKQNGIVYAGSDFGVTAISTLFIEPNKDFSDLYVYPNPVNLSSEQDVNIVIDGLIEDSEIKILDISGKVIDEFRSIGGKTTTWDCRNMNGQLISSGIYIVVAFDAEVNEIGHAKFAVLRK